MARYTKVVQVPEPEKGSYNPNRPAGILLRSQALHLRETLFQHLKELVTILAIDPKTLKSERDVSAYVHRATAILHTFAAKPEKE
jgi:hypothetical protein